MRCPLETNDKSGDKTDIYESFLSNVEEFWDIDALPTEVCFEKDETADNFALHSASWHRSCYLKFSNSKLARAMKRTHDLDDSKSRKPNKRQALDIQKCFLCDKSSEDDDLHEVSTFDADKNIRTMITELNDTTLMTRIVGGDLMAIEAKYHLQCLVKLRNRYRSHGRKASQTPENTDEKMNESRAFVELTNYIEKALESGIFLFKLTEIHSLYINRLEELGIKKLVNKTRLKNHLLEHFSEAQEQHDGRNTVLIFKAGMKDMLKEALRKRDFDEDAVILAKAARIVRSDIFNHKGFKFTGSFPAKCQEKSLPSSLKYLVSMIINGPNLKDQEKQESQACLTAGQTILYHTKRETYKTSSAMTSRHTLEREPPLPIYVGISIHALTRSKKLVQRLYQMGLSISYDRIAQIEDWMSASTCERFAEDGVVAPACLYKGLFTVGALDNLDHNPSSTTSVTSFHGTGISLFQLPTKNNPGEKRSSITIPPSGDQTHALPHSYASVPAVALKTTSVSVPECDTFPVERCLDNAKTEEHSWVEHALPLLTKENLSKEDVIAWAAYHASIQPPLEDPPARSALLPLFYEKSATPAMIKHGMNVVREAVEYLNPGQIPVTTFDQPLFALAKFVQWKWPDTHGERVHVVMLGGLHIEMALWSTLGDLLQGSGWTTALTEAQVASAGISDSFLKAAHLTRTRHAHQVTLLALHHLQQEAFRLSAAPSDERSTNAWKENMLKCPTFLYWDQIMRYETLILIFIKAQREKNFTLYVEVLEELIPMFFALDHVNYSRWMPVHIRDMKSLPATIMDEFKKDSHWVLSKTCNKFSAIPFDHAHEQENKIVKGAGGAVGLTENRAAFRRWMLSGPELARLVKEFEEEYLEDDSEDPKSFQHHEQGLSTQRTFQRHVTSLTETIRQMGNPFLDDFQDLVALDSRNCTDKSVIQTIQTWENTGKKQYQEYVKKVLEERTHSIHDPIKRNSMALFRKPQCKKIQQKGKIKVLQNNVALFGQLYIAMQNREGDLDEFFAHEIQSFPPSLSDLGKLHLPGTKSDLLKCLEQPEQTDPPSTYDCKVLDGAVIVHCLPIVSVSTFDMYAGRVFIPYLEKQLQDTKRLDIVWDTYIPNSLKESTREKRGKGVRRKVSGNAKLPTNWMGFLCEPTNKKELFAHLTSRIEEFSWPPDKAVYVTSKQGVSSIGACINMIDCNHEEADTRIMVHTLHALEQGAKTVLVRTVDTDVIVILVGIFHDLLVVQPLADIWIAFGMGKKYRYYHINAICRNLGESKSRALPVFHAYSGCDTTSAFSGKGKKSAWHAWQVYDDVTETFVYLAKHPFEFLDINSEHFQRLERLTIILYDKSSSVTSINETRKKLFCHNNKAMERLPPTQDALLQHTRRAVYQAGVWTTSLETHQRVPSPQDYAWTKESGSWVPVWITAKEVSEACRELIKCSCKGDCSACKCSNANLDCSPLCKCKCN